MADLTADSLVAQKAVLKVATKAWYSVDLWAAWMAGLWAAPRDLEGFL